MASITQVREGNAKFDLIINDNMPEVFTDGFSQLLMGTPISKLTFHSVMAPPNADSGVEQRQGVLRLAIATPVLLELCKNILFAAQENIEVLSESGNQIDIQIKKIMEDVNIKKSSS
jgi:hypothetical protein